MCRERHGGGLQSTLNKTLINNRLPCVWGMASELADGVGRLLQSVRKSTTRGAVGSVGGK